MEGTVNDDVVTEHKRKQKKQNREKPAHMHIHALRQPYLPILGQQVKEVERDADGIDNDKGQVNP